MSSSYVLHTSGQLSLSGGSGVLVNQLNLSTPLSLSQGGSGGSYASAADFKSDFNLVAGTDLQAYHAYLQDLANSEPSANQILKYDGSNWVPATPSGGTTYSADESSLHLDGSNVFSVAANGISSSQLSTSCVDGSTITGGNGSALSVGTISSANLQSGCVTDSILASGSVSASKLGSDVVDGVTLALNGDNKIVLNSVPTNKLSLDGSTLYNDGGDLAVKNNGIGVNQLSSAVAGDGLQGGGGDALAVDNSVVRTSGAFTLSGQINLSNQLNVGAAVNYQGSGQSSFAYVVNGEALSFNDTVCGVGSLPLQANAVSVFSGSVSACSQDLSQYLLANYQVAMSYDGSTSTIRQSNISYVCRSDTDLSVSVSADDNAFNLLATGLNGVSMRWFSQISEHVIPVYNP